MKAALAVGAGGVVAVQLEQPVTVAVLAYDKEGATNRVLGTFAALRHELL
jgi:hypothetical protein